MLPSRQPEDGQLVALQDLASVTVSVRECLPACMALRMPLKGDLNMHLGAEQQPSYAAPALPLPPLSSLQTQAYESTMLEDT